MKYLIYIILEFKQYLWSGNQNNETLIVIDDNNMKRNRVDPGGNLIKILEDLVRSWKIL